MHARQLLGRQGEDLAAAHLTANGYELLHRNWQATGEGVRGELDIVARDRDTLAICEVKTRRSPVAGSPFEGVGHDKRRRLRRLTALYLQAHPHRGPIRGDVIGIDVRGPLDGPDTTLVHLRGVW